MSLYEGKNVTFSKICRICRTIEEMEFFAEKYQVNKKYGDEFQELPKIETKLRNLIEQSHQLAVQLRDMSS